MIRRTKMTRNYRFEWYKNERYGEPLKRHTFITVSPATGKVEKDGLVRVCNAEIQAVCFGAAENDRDLSLFFDNDRHTGVLKNKRVIGIQSYCFRKIPEPPECSFRRRPQDLPVYGFFHLDLHPDRISNRRGHFIKEIAVKFVFHNPSLKIYL